MRVIVAGGAGFLGSHLSEFLVNNGHEVVVVDNLSSGQEDNLKFILDKVKFIQSDISNFDYNGNIDVIINLASRASRVEWEKHPVEVALSNSLGNNNLIRLALKHKALYMYASSSEVYGNPDVIPTPETFLGRVNTIGSRSPYDEGKRFGEALVKAYEREYGLKNVIMRFFNTYGPRMRGGDFYGRVVDRFIHQAIEGEPITVYGDGSQTRSFTYVTDSVKAIYLLLQRGTSGQVYNVGNDKETQIIDLANIVREISNSNSEIKFHPLPEDDPKRRAADISKLRSLGFAHQIDLRQGLEKMIEFTLKSH